MSILIATPCYAGLVTAQHMKSALRLSWAFDAAGLEHDWDLGWNESLVHRARMEMSAKWERETEFTHQFWWDADIEAEPDAVAALWNLQADIAVGCYMMKKPTERWFSAWKDGKLINLDECGTEPFAVDYAGTGFMLVSRKAVEKIKAHIERKHAVAKQLIDRLHNHDCIDNDEERAVADEMVDAMGASYEGRNGHRIPALYTTPIYRDGLESEDYHFCRIAREAGIKVMMDPNVRLTHWGQYPYGADQIRPARSENAA